MSIRRTFTAILGADAVAADTPYILVSLADTTNYSHDRTAEIWLMGLSLTAEKATDGAYRVYVGVIVENDATNGSTEWLHVFHLQATGNPTDSTDRYVQTEPFTLGGPDGTNLEVDTTNNTLRYTTTSRVQADSTDWQNDTAIVSTSGTSTPGVGDLAVWVDEISGSGTLDFTIRAVYETP